MKTIKSFLILFLFACLYTNTNCQDTYNNSWIDFNKNGKKDIYEDQYPPIDKPLENLVSQMNTNEKTAQMVTL